MKLVKYPNTRAKRTHRKANLPKDEFERLYAISEEWTLVSVDDQKAVFKPRGERREEEV